MKVLCFFCLKLFHNERWKNEMGFLSFIWDIFKNIWVKVKIFYFFNTSRRDELIIHKSLMKN